jgi:hypothetical protein
VRCAGELHAGPALSIYDYGSPYLLENEVLREQLRLIAEEMDARASASGNSVPGGTPSASPSQRIDSSAYSTPARRTHSNGSVVRPPHLCTCFQGPHCWPLHDL